MDASLYVVILISAKKHAVKFSLVFIGKRRKKLIVEVEAPRGSASIPCKHTKADTVSLNFSYCI